MAFKRILCAVDFSDDSTAALKRGIELAKQSAGELFLFHCMEVQPSYPGWTLWEQLGDITLQLEEKAKESMDSLMDSSPQLQELPFTTEIGNGRAFAEITKKSKEWKADLIVLGAQGGAGLDDVIIGSTARRVMETAPCSVLVVRR